MNKRIVARHELYVHRSFARADRYVQSILLSRPSPGIVPLGDCIQHRMLVRLSRLARMQPGNIGCATKNLSRRPARSHEKIPRRSSLAQGLSLATEDLHMRH